MKAVVFSIDKWWDLHTLAKFTRCLDTLRAMEKLVGDVKTCVGSYESKPELSFIMLEVDFNEHVRGTHWVAEQESFLVVPSDQRQPAYLDYQGVVHETLGPVVEGKGQEAGWTYRPDMDKYFTTMRKE